ncbi:ATP-grasp domain-containing protein [Kosakonia cowanii]|uniref:ATP-grasp domain-containing protein n=1 Tax=Kosakonia cowanii TaxID=208223 RepID=UPI0039A4D99F
MTATRNALILDAGFASLPLQRAVKAAGFTTLVCSGKPHDAGMKAADTPIVQNYADYDAVLDVARKYAISAITPGVTDVSYLTGSRVAAELGLPGFDTPDVSDTLFLKDRFRAWAEQQGYPIPRAVKEIEAARHLPFPLLVKPIDAYSGIGITQVHHADELEGAVQEARSASRNGECVIETFCQGALYSHSAFIRGGEIVCEFFVDEFCTVYPWQVNSSCLSLALTESMRDRVSECLQTLVRQLGLVDGLLHTQFIAGEEDFWLIELTRRCPGDLYSRLIELSTGVDYSSAFIAPFLGHADTDTFSARRPAHLRAIARHTISGDDDTDFAGYHFAPLAAHIIEAVPLKLPGDPLLAAPRDRAGLIFAEFANFTELARLTPQLKNYFLFKTL